MGRTHTHILLRMKYIISGLLILTCALGFAFRGELLVACGDYLNSEQPLRPADAILVFAGGVPERMMEAVELYKAGYAPKIVLTRGEEPENLAALRSYGVPFLETHEMNLQIAAASGVPEGVVTVLEPRINSTYMEAELLRDYCLKEGYRLVILVTSKSHTTRAYKIFEHVTRGQVRAIPHASRYDTFDPKSWWRTRRTAKEVLFEYEKLAHYTLILLTGG